jgi:hypothetical protein
LDRPLCRSSCPPYKINAVKRVSSNGKTTASQAVNVGSIPITRSS